jgi:hypothetical protein
VITTFPCQRGVGDMNLASKCIVLSMAQDIGLLNNVYIDN